MVSRAEDLLDTVAVKLDEIHKSAEDGILVLNIKYEFTLGLQKCLSDLQLVLAKEGLSIQRQSEDFLRKQLAKSS